jgi:hypothetical protein
MANSKKFATDQIAGTWGCLLQYQGDRIPCHVDSESMVMQKYVSPSSLLLDLPALTRARAVVRFGRLRHLSLPPLPGCVPVDGSWEARNELQRSGPTGWGFWGVWNSINTFH